MNSFSETEVVEVMEHSNASSGNTDAGLSDEEKREIDREFSHYEGRASVGLEALRIVQKHRGWVSDKSLQAVADYLEIAPAQLESVATYFQLIFRQPVGREVMLLCKSASCWITGCSRLQVHIRKRLQIAPGQTSKDGIFTLLETPCLGDCDKGPVMQVGEEMHRHLTEEAIDKLIEQKIHKHKKNDADRSTD
ncbi:NADH-quinone oxidoreductase subunit NuoE [Microbulbifer halophilus]|uniref:NADH-quinone oxidoreductase subunit E n=1 Tax=Microbulbifer halophilus TaxID=453963 RepID=A0ABW5E832_9GAMM|nr:NADH-quinone oxidoreductase subunit NuoE [Microbulbifer halophilus]